jgi:dethiobiotin synthase
MTNKGIFITGTDTGVGKTVATAVIARILRGHGVKVGVMKPVTSGCIVIDGKLVSEDAELLKWASATTAADSDIAPYLLSAPLAPSAAATLDGTRICFSTIRAAYERLAAVHDFAIILGGLIRLFSNSKFLLNLRSFYIRNQHIIQRSSGCRIFAAGHRWSPPCSNRVGGCC